MEENRELHEDGPHILPGPHRAYAGELPAGFAPLRLLVLPERRVVEIAHPAVVIGRHTDADLRVALPDVSRRHCRIAFEQGLWRLFDLDSLNGVFLNDERVHEAALGEGDRIRLGEMTLIVEGVGGGCQVADGPQAEMLKSIADALPRKAG